MRTTRINVTYLGQSFSLTQRVAECLILTALGFPKKYTADRLGISYRTAEKHIRIAKEKIGIHNHKQLIDFLFSSQMSSPSINQVAKTNINIDKTNNVNNQNIG